ncbi:MAG: 23S rRNA (uracil(1939)-C(5))-methyltransferase RlmD [Christensenellales bacterium]
MAPVKVNEKIVLQIDDIGGEGQGIGKYNGFTVFVDNSLPGETVETLITKVTKNYAAGKLLRIVTASPNRMEPACPVFSQCGSCELLHMKYKAQLAWKEKRVQDCLKRIGGLLAGEYSPIIGMEEPCRYRNKLACSVSEGKNKIRIGMFAAKSYEITDIKGCILHDEESLKVMALVEQWANSFQISVYNKAEQKGLLRHVIARRAADGELMAVLVVNGQAVPHKTELIALLQQVPGLHAILLNVNQCRDQVILGEKDILIWGKDTIEETVSGLKFSVSVQSFFQVNRIQAERLYSAAIEMAQLSGSETVFDLYCGTGTITQLMARKARQAIGIEAVPAAVEDAKKSAGINHSKARFYLGKAEEIFPALAKEYPPDVVILDPPRKGCESSLLQCINRVQPKRIVYISCNPATLARDAAILAKDGGYSLEKVQPVDMFPHTTHVETIVLMSRAEK